MEPLPRISEAEYEIMKVIWNHAPINTDDVVERLSVDHEWSPKTIQTMLSRLVKKGALGYEKQSRVFVYTPLIAEKDYLNEESRSFLQRFYNGTMQKMVLNFLEQDKLSDEDIEELKLILAAKEGKGGEHF